MKPVAKTNDKGYFSVQLITLIFISIFFGVILHIYLPNIGGVGLELPLNIMSCFCIAFFIFIISIRTLKCEFIYFSKTSNLISSGLFILILLCLFSPFEYRYNAYLIAGWLFGALVFYQLLMQIKMSNFCFNFILLTLLIACVIESLIAMAQVFNLYPIIGLFYPPLSEGRPYGIFQQVNVFSSFICVGIASGFGLLSRLKKLSWLGRGFILISIILMSATIPLSQSLTGYLSLFLIVLSFFIFLVDERKNIIYLILAITIGVIIGYLVKGYLNISDMSENKLQTSHVRWVLWQHSLYLFSENFLWGSGVGSFESVFLERFGGGLLGTSGKTMSHPHNEILRWMVEGGLAGVIGILLVALGGIYLWLSSLKNRNVIYLITSLPIVVHMMTEFPLWLSTPHAVVLILLLRCADSQQNKYRVSKPVAVSLKSILAVFGLLSLVFLSLTLQAQQYLTHIEKTGQQAILSKNNVDRSEWNYLFLYDRYSYDLHMGYLLRYNETNDTHYLNLFNDWAEVYSRSHPDINVYFSRYLVLNALGQDVAARKTYEKAKWLFVNDGRFE